MKQVPVKSRVVHKMDTAEHWSKAVGFIPLRGEIIIYDSESLNKPHRFKIGDGIRAVTDLPFMDQIDNVYDDTIDGGQIMPSIQSSLDGGNILSYSGPYKHIDSGAII